MYFLVFVSCVYVLLVVMSFVLTASPVTCVERLVFEVMCHVSSWTFNSANSVKVLHSVMWFSFDTYYCGYI